MMFSFTTTGYTPRWDNSSVSCTGMLGIPASPAKVISVSWEPRWPDRGADAQAFNLVEQVFYRARLWGMKTPIYPYMLRNSSDWGVAWQLWRMWYEYTTQTPAPGATRRGLGWSKYLTSPSNYWSDDVEQLLSRRYEDADKDMNWCRFVQLLTSAGWNRGHAPWLGAKGEYALPWLLYVGNAPRKDVVYTTELRGINAQAQGTASWFDAMRIAIPSFGPRLTPVADGKDPVGTLRRYRKLMADLTQEQRDTWFRGNFAKHVLEFEL